MKNINKVRNFFVICSLIILFLGAFSYIVRLGAKSYVSLKGKGNAFTGWLFKDQPTLNKMQEEEKREFIIYNTDWSEIYPFSGKPAPKVECAANKTQTAETGKKPQKAEKTKIAPSKVYRMPAVSLKPVQAIERWYGRFFRRAYFAQLMQTVECKAKWNMMPPNKGGNIVTGAVTLPDGHLTIYEKRKNMAPVAKSIESFAGFCKSQKIPFMYVQAPGVISPKNKRINGNWDFSNENADELLEKLTDAGIECFDLRPEVLNDFEKYEDAFFVTDHHWKIETGLWAAGKLAEKFRKNYGIPFNPGYFVEENYDKKVYEKWCLGSYGKKATLGRCTPDDFPLFFPKQQAYFHYTNPYANDDITGGFECIYHYEHLEPKDYYNQHVQETYMHCHGLISIDNLKPEGKGRLLFVGDSYLQMVVPFLAEQADRIDFVSMDYFTGSLESFVKKNGPYDAAIMLFYPGDLQENINFDSHSDHFDFR